MGPILMPFKCSPDRKNEDINLKLARLKVPSSPIVQVLQQHRTIQSLSETVGVMPEPKFMT
jgi:hypothetical protein